MRSNVPPFMVLLTSIATFVVVPRTLDGATICFDVQIDQSDGTRSYVVGVAGCQ